MQARTELKADVLNTFHQNDFRVSFSNFPVIEELKSDAGIVKPVDMRVFDYYVRNIVIPDQSLQTSELSYLNRVQLQPMSRGNDNLNAVVVEFKVDDAFLNYYLFYTYIRQMRTGLVDVQTFYKNRIREMNVDGFNNAGFKTSRLTFVNLFPVSTGTLSLEYGSSEELTFAVSFNYEEFKVEMYGDTPGYALPPV